MAVKDLPVCITTAGSLILPMADVVYFSDSGSVDFGDPVQNCVVPAFQMLDCSPVNNQLEPIGKFARRPHYVQG